MGAELSVVIPMLNEARVLPATLAELTGRFPSSSTEILLVDDGSIDDSAGLAEHLSVDRNNIEVIRLPRNLGKGAALRAGIARTTSPVVRLMRLATGLDIHDSQCGFKAFRGDVARLLFLLSTNDRFAFDPEVLRIGVALGYSIDEVPVEWAAGDYSAVRPIRDSIRTALDLIPIRVRTRRTRMSGLAARCGLPVPEPIDAAPIA